MEEIRNNQEEMSEPEIEGSGYIYFYVCSECHGLINWKEPVCPHCNRRINWNG